MLIVNVSRGGLLLRSESPPAVGEDVDIRHRGVSIQGKVVRADQRRFAVQAYEAIDLERLLAKVEISSPSAMKRELPSQSANWKWQQFTKR